MNVPSLKYTRSSLRHLRVPFSLFLLPVYLMALVLTPGSDLFKAAGIFVSLHLFLYPGSSGFNAFYDRDRSSIGMLENPPEVTPDLLGLSLLLKTAAVLTALSAGPVMACGCLLYAVASVLYSWDRVRIKKHPFAGWLLTGIGQGFVMSVTMVVSLPATGPALPSPLQLAGAASVSVMILAASPLFEIFQHEEDALRGDLTISRFAGVRGTLILSGTLFAVSTTGLAVIIGSTMSGFIVRLFLFSLAPALTLFIRVLIRFFRRGIAPGYRAVMPIALAASGGLNGFCVAVLLVRFLTRH